jgi:hypothetical protein
MGKEERENVKREATTIYVVLLILMSDLAGSNTRKQEAALILDVGCQMPVSK